MEDQNDFNGYQALESDQPTGQPESTPVEVPQAAIEQPQPASAPAQEPPTSVATAEAGPDQVASYYRYVGGGAWLVGVPARDLTMAEVEANNFTQDELLAFGLYELVQGSEEKD